MNKSYNKYFVIGFNKTATSTFHNIFMKNQLESQHATEWDTDKYTCFSDNGDLNNFKQLDSKYDNSIFILNVREIDKWLISRFKHGLRIDDKPNWGYPCTYEKCKDWIKYRQKYHRDVLKYFSKSPSKLIIVNIDRPGWENFVCSQLNFKENNFESKNIHETKTYNIEHQNIINKVNYTLNKDKYNKSTVLFPKNKLLKKYLKIYNNYI
jgi:hypothetical protein